jgi:hypothetical protein
MTGMAVVFGAKKEIPGQIDARKQKERIGEHHDF